MPQNLGYDCWKIDRDNRVETPLMIWIRSRNYYNVPKELYYGGWKTDRNKDGETPLMLWIHTYPSENIP